jgi:MraZ protein
MGQRSSGKSAVNKMEPNETVEPKYFNSLYRHGVDEKRRVQIPAKWRPETLGTEFTLVVWPSGNQGPCLRVFPPQEMAKLVRTINEMPANEKKGALKRSIGAGSEQAVLDKAGRICLPEPMAKAAGIDGEAILVGLLDRFEIWNPERYEQMKTADAVMASDAFRLME